MARTAEVGILIRNNGTPLGQIGFTIIDLTGSLSATDEGGGVVDVTGSGGGGGGTNVATQVVTGVQSGNNTTLDLTTLSHVFVAVEAIFRNGQLLTPITDWSLVSTTATVTNVSATDVYQVQYTY